MTCRFDLAVVYVYLNVRQLKAAGACPEGVEAVRELARRLQGRRNEVRS